jgi:integral membrane protein
VFKKRLFWEVVVLKTPVSRFRVVGFLEGISFLLLLFVAMPLKYMFNFPMPVTVVGALHGILFILYILAIVYVMITVRWPITKVLLALFASVIPFGPFIFDGWLKKAPVADK